MAIKINSVSISPSQVLVGENIIVVVATDKAGKTTTITRTIILDTSAPVIASVNITPNPVNVGGNYTITVTVTG